MYSESSGKLKPNSRQTILENFKKLQAMDAEKLVLIQLEKDKELLERQNEDKLMRSEEYAVRFMCFCEKLKVTKVTMYVYYLFDCLYDEKNDAESIITLRQMYKEYMKL